MSWEQSGYRSLTHRKNCSSSKSHQRWGAPDLAHALRVQRTLGTLAHTHATRISP